MKELIIAGVTSCICIITELYLTALKIADLRSTEGKTLTVHYCSVKVYYNSVTHPEPHLPRNIWFHIPSNFQNLVKTIALLNFFDH